MKWASLIFSIVLSVPCAADSALSFLVPSGRIALGYGQGFVNDVKPSTIQDFDRTRPYWIEVESDTLLALHFGMRFAFDDAAQVTFADAGSTRGELYLSTIQLGFKFNVPIGFLRSFAGAGAMGGFLAVSNPDNRPTQGFGVPWSRETAGIRAFYLHGGFDIMFNPQFGIRLSYQHDFIETNRFGNLNRTGVDFTHSSAQAGFVFASK